MRFLFTSALLCLTVTSYAEVASCNKELTLGKLSEAKSIFKSMSSRMTGTELNLKLRSGTDKLCEAISTCTAKGDDLKSSLYYPCDQVMRAEDSQNVRDIQKELLSQIDEAKALLSLTSSCKFTMSLYEHSSEDEIVDGKLNISKDECYRKAAAFEKKLQKKGYPYPVKIEFREYP